MKKLAHTLPYDAAIMGDTSLPEKMAKAVKIPALIAFGEKSDTEIHKAAEALGNLIPGSKLSIVKGQDHRVDMKVLAPIITAFFNGN